MPNAAMATLDRLQGALQAARRRPDRLAQRLGEVGLATCLLLTPFLLGGRHDASRLVYIVGASLAASGMLCHAALTRRHARLPGWLLVVLSGSAALLALQIVSAPGPLIDLLSPRLSELLPLWGDGAPFGPWTTLSVTPAETRESLALLLAHGLFAIALLLRVRDAEHVGQLMIPLAAVAIVMAVLGFLQHSFGDGTLLGVYDHPQRQFTRVQGAFANKNHFAHFLLLGLGPTLWLALRQVDTDRDRRNTRELDTARLRRNLAWVGAIVLLVVGVLASQSRGGVASLGVATLVTVGLLYRADKLRLPHVAAAIVAVVAVLVGVSMMGYEKITGRVDDLFSGELDTLDSNQARRAIWGANLAAFSASPWVGFGAGSHRDVYPAFIEDGYGVEFTHAESGYLQIASETGAFGLLMLAILVGGVGATVVRGVTSGRSSDFELKWVAIVPGLVGSLVHSFVDFVWYLPGLLAPTIALAVAAIRLREQADGHTAKVRSRSELARYVPVGLASTAACLAIGISYGPATASGDWDSVQRAAVARRGMIMRLVREEPERADPMLASTVDATTARMTELLGSTLQADPSSAVAHQRLATRLLERFETQLRETASGMTLDLVADTARRGGFGSHAEMLAWLERAYGDGARLLSEAAWHAEQAVRLSPLQGEAYLHLASLAFLLDGGPSEMQLTSQALNARPHDGDVLFEAGRRHWLAGDSERAMTHWNKSIDQPGSHVAKLVTHVARIAPASAFVESLEPDRFAMTYALAQYAACGDEQDMLALCDYTVAEAERLEADGEESSIAVAGLWRQASFSYRTLGRIEEAVEAATRASELAPHLYPMRLELALTLRLAERYDEADVHIRWCLARRPDVRYLRAWLEESAKRRTLVDRNRRRRHALFDSVASRPVGSADQRALDSESTQNADSRPGVQR